MPEPLVPSCAICRRAHILPGTAAYNEPRTAPQRPTVRASPCRPAPRSVRGSFAFWPLFSLACRHATMAPSGRADPGYTAGPLCPGPAPWPSPSHDARAKGFGCRGSGAWAKRPPGRQPQSVALWPSWPNGLKDQGFTPGRRQTVCYAGWHVENVSTAQPERQARGASSSHHHRPRSSLRVHVLRLPGLSPGCAGRAPGAEPGHTVWRRRRSPREPGHRPGQCVRHHGEAAGAVARPGQGATMSTTLYRSLLALWLGACLALMLYGLRG